MRFNNWNLEMDKFPVRQYDNLTRRLEVSGDIPEGWSWAALLSIGDNLNIISLQYGEPGLYVDLTADMIPYAGKYNLQLKATQGEKARHTNIVQFTVNESMSGDVQWPELPSAFSQAVEQAQEAANTAKEAALQYPKIIDGYWWVYDANSGKFVNSGIYAGGSAPYIGENGNWFVGGEDTGIAATGQQGWSVSAAALDDDGALVLTIRNPADGSTQQLPPVPIDNSAALQAVAEAITAQGTAQVQRVESAGSTAVGEVSTAKDAALHAVDQAQTSATGAVSSAQTAAVQAVRDAQETAEEAIGAAQTAAVEAVEAKGAEEQGKLNAIVPPPTPEDAGKALVANEDGTGLKYGDAPAGLDGLHQILQYTHQGNQEIYLSDFDFETATGHTTEPHGLTQATEVIIVPEGFIGATQLAQTIPYLCAIPTEWVFFSGNFGTSKIYLLPTSETGITVVGNDKQTPVVAVLDNNNSRLDFTKFHFEVPAAYHLTGFEIDLSTAKMLFLAEIGAGSLNADRRYYMYYGGNNQNLVGWISINGKNSEGKKYGNLWTCTVQVVFTDFRFYQAAGIQSMTFTAKEKSVDSAYACSYVSATPSAQMSGGVGKINYISANPGIANKSRIILWAG